MKYAQSTTVSVEKSKAEIDKLLGRYGATSYASGWDADKAIVQFELRKKRIKFVLPLPSLDDFKTTAEGRQRHQEWTVRKAWEQGCRSLWRALLLIIKAKLEAVESGVSSFETEFGMVTVMPDGRTVGEIVTPSIEAAYSTGRMPPMLGMGT